jgi:hypothetical protein
MFYSLKSLDGPVIFFCAFETGDAVNPPIDKPAV